MIDNNTKKIKRTNIKQDYKFIKELGSGRHGVVFLVQHKTTSEYRAIKAIPKQDGVMNELKILRKLDHPNILKLHEAYETDKTVFLVTELCQGGELYYHMTKTTTLTEIHAATIIRQILSAVKYLHENKIVHRDIKPENFMLQSVEDELSIKLIDFGLAKSYKSEEVMTEAKGTALYLAPEVIEGQYAHQVDNWSIGIILYMMLTGEHPFKGKQMTELMNNIKKGKFTFGRVPMSQQVKELIQNLLEKNPTHRYSAEQAYNHPWVQSGIEPTMVCSSGIVINLDEVLMWDEDGLEEMIIRLQRHKQLQQRNKQRMCIGYVSWQITVYPIHQEESNYQLTQDQHIE